MVYPNQFKYTQNKIREIIESYNYEVVDISNYINNRNYIILKDSENYYYSIMFKNFIRKIKKENYKPDRFGKYNPFTIQNITNWLKLNNISLEVISKDPININKRIWFHCNVCNKDFDARWGEIYRGRKCPYCTNQWTTDNNSFYINYPELVEEWDFDKNKNIDIKSVSYGCAKKVWWICKNAG
jgi:hypothetical protein